ncbi:hypothetical protein ACSBR2_025724 [Camellia fascicularis]
MAVPALAHCLGPRIVAIVTSPSPSSLSSTPTTTTPITTNVFDVGKYTTLLLSAEPNTCTTTKSSLSLPPPKPLLIAIPDVAGEFPLLLLLHGYLLHNSFYSQLIPHIASHGFIVVAPQLYTVAGPDSTDEIKSAVAITYWLPSGLHKLLPTHVQPNLTKIRLSGHSRGGKAAFALALGKTLLMAWTKGNNSPLAPPPPPPPPPSPHLHTSFL